ncbi:MAG: PorT family protein [Chitinophagaceae bacterium]|nr:PorT family protein [Chitinophagaceae bacterium]
MKRIILLAGLCTGIINTYAQFSLPLDPNDASGALRRAIEAYNEDPRKENKKKVKMAIDAAFVAGLNFSTITGESESYKGFLPGFLIGARMNISRPDRKIVADAGILFSMEGSKYEAYGYEPGGSSGNSAASLRLNYLRIPVTAKYRADINRGFFAEAGLQPGLLLTAKDKRNGDTYNAKEGYKSFDLGIVLGAGYQINRKFGVEVKAIPGVTNINKTETMYEAPKDRNLSLSLRASYRFM